MVPVQVRVVSASSCSLSQASALLERFLSSNACSDSFATDYVANVAQALQDSISGGLEHTKHRRFPTSSESQLVDVKQSAPSILSAAEDVVQDAVVAMEVGSAMPEAEGAFKRHKKKRRHSAVENGVLPSVSEMEDSTYMHQVRKRRKKEKNERETEDYGPDDKKHHDKKKRKEEHKIETGYYAPDSQKLHGKKGRKKEKDMETTENRGSQASLLVDENLDKKSACKAKKKAEVHNKVANNTEVSVMRLSSKLEEQAGSSKRKRKEDKAFLLTTPSKVPFLENNIEEASPLEFESLASEEKKKTKKKRRKEELCELVGQTLSG